MMSLKTKTLVFFFGFSMLGTTCLPAQENQIDFNRDIRPILADTCYKCHGPDEQDRQADLRLDDEEGLFDSGAVVANDLDASELYQRIISDDPDTLMPPPDSNRKLTDEQKSLLKRWIEQGAKWQLHWSLVAPKRPALPQSELDGWATNEIDQFVAARWGAANLKPRPEADRLTLIRRVTFDLTGLPPSPALVKKYAANESEHWYEQLVDELLASPAYGEHMARYWLDAARYGDTHGLHLDNYREMWLYRDWVVNAYNRNLSYRDFTIHQLAGDLMDAPTEEQMIASGFNRAHVTTNEGGSIKEEVYVRNVVDRVATTGTVFMGLTVGCAQCHDHKFDPISQKEFYQLFAYFNNLTDPPMDKNIKDPQPVIRVMNESQREQSSQLTEARDAAKQAFEKAIGEFEYEDPFSSDDDAEDDSEVAAGDSPNKPTEFIWIEDHSYPIGNVPGGSFESVSGDKVPAKSNQASRKQSGSGTIQHFFTNAAFPLTASKGDQFFADVYLDPENPPTEVMLQFNDGNWEHRVYWGENKIDWGASGKAGRFYAGDLPETGQWVRLKIEVEKVGFEKKSKINGFAFTQFGGTAYWDTAGIISKHEQFRGFDSLSKWTAFARTKGNGTLPNPLKKIAKLKDDKINDAQREKLRRHFLINVYQPSISQLRPLSQKLDQAQKALSDFEKSIPTTLVSKERNEMKPAFMLNRGEYDQRGDQVERMTPKALPPFDESMPNNRLGFAQWLTSGTHPLTARVAVNRYWQQLFGTGLVKTSEDFGAQGENPSHPELLDWLAVDFVDSGWDVKRLIKTMVLTSTYRQASAASADDYQRDPENRFLARGPRFRLDAEMLRDQALAVSGLLDRKLGGPSVKPPQPDGLWFAVGYSGSNTVRFRADQGREKVFRRSLYTFWKRTAPPPQLNTFDAPSREECRVRRERTNTPLQALLLMNEPQYLEAARHLAQAALKRNEQADEKTIAFLFESAMKRPAKKGEVAILTADLQQHRKDFNSNEVAAKQLIEVGEVKADPQADPIELASLTMVANLIMNMDEFLNKN